MSEHRRILVVDDEPQITRVLRTSLSSQGYDIRVANDGETALEIMKDIHHVGTKADRSGDLIGISAAIERYVVADNRASEALKKEDKASAPTPIADAVRRFRESAGLNY